MSSRDRGPPEPLFVMLQPLSTSSCALNTRCYLPEMLRESEPTWGRVIYASGIGSSTGITAAHSGRTRLPAGEERKALSEDLKKVMEQLQRRGTHALQLWKKAEGRLR